MATQKLNITRDQLATFLKNHELVKQFEKLVQIVDEVAPSSDTQGIGIQAANADATANEALSSIIRLAQDVAIDVGNADQKATQALDTLNRIADALEFLAQAPAKPTCAEAQDLDLSPLVQIGTLGEQQADRVDIKGGVVSARLKNNQTILLEATSTLSDGSALEAGTLLNAPAAGNPTKWVAIDDNGTTRYIPTW